MRLHGIDEFKEKCLIDWHLYRKSRQGKSGPASYTINERYSRAATKFSGLKSIGAARNAKLQ